MQTHHPYARLNTFHGPKRQLLGNHAGKPPPSWRTTAPTGPGQTDATVSNGSPAREQGSRIFLSRLPVDVGEKDVEASARCDLNTLPFDHVNGSLLGTVQKDGGTSERIILGV